MHNNPQLDPDAFQKPSRRRKIVGWWVWITLLSLAALVLPGCIDQEEQARARKQQRAAEQARMMTAADSLGWNASPDSLGMIVEILAPGDSVRPRLADIVTVAYQVQGLNGVVVDSAPVEAPLRMRLARLIESWQLALPRIGQGGQLRMIVPSHLAYGPVSIHPEVGAHAPLLFIVELIRVES